MGFLSGIFGPKIPKPREVADQQIRASEEIGGQQYQFMPNQILPGVGQTWTPGPDGRFQSQTSLSPENQALFGQELENRGQLGSGLGSLLGNYSSNITTPFNATQEGMDATLGGAGTANIVGEQFWGPQRSWRDSQLRNQGLTPTNSSGQRSVAYDQSMTELGQNQFMQYLSSIMPWQQAMADQATTSRNTNFDNISQLLKLSTPSIPISPANYVPYNGSVPNMAEINKTAYDQGQARANAVGSFIGNVGGAFLGMPAGSSTLGGVVGGGLSNMLNGVNSSSPWMQPGYIPSPLTYGS